MGVTRRPQVVGRDCAGQHGSLCPRVDTPMLAMMLAIAEAFRALPKRPERSILFASVGAEEQGLLGRPGQVS